MSRDAAVLSAMITEGFIPSVGAFEITEQLRDAFYETYGRLFGRKSRIRNSDVRYAKKLAGLSLLKLLKSREEETKVETVKKTSFGIKEGFIYMISNPAFPGFLKIGMTTDVHNRLSAYQTYDPLKRYKIEMYKFVEDRRAYESSLLGEFGDAVSNGEWLHEEAKDAVVEKYFRA